MNSPCPDTYPVKLPQLFFEVVWDTRQFNDQSDWPEDGSQPFVFSFGNTTGYGQHGDYIFGWEGDALQRAMDDNCNVDCPTLQSQDTDTANQCTIPRCVDEEIDGSEFEFLDSPEVPASLSSDISKDLSQLPGDNPITG